MFEIKGNILKNEVCKQTNKLGEKKKNLGN